MSKVGRNDLCPCGSGKKYKKCCMLKESVVGTDIRVAHYSENHEIIKEEFLKRGINIDSPGFYNNEKFISIENGYPSYLNNYARYIQTKSYSAEYFERARKEIPVIATILYKQLAKDGRKGACIDMSGVFSKILEREGYWNYIAKGSLTLKYPADTGIPDGFYWHYGTDSRASAGHAWVVVPPFSVVDITIKQQPYDKGQENYLSDLVIEECGKESNATVKEIICPEIFCDLKYHRIKEEQMLDVIGSDGANVMKIFPPLELKSKDTLLKYITLAIAAPDVELEDITGLKLNGMYGIDIYKQLIIPELKKVRTEI